MTKDTIVAVATPHGVGGIAVVRLSGPDALSIASSHLSPLISHLSPRHATYCRFDDLDDIVVVYFQAPHSYTGEEVVEISCHGSLYIQQALLDALIESGARLAAAGEFTMRAFVNGRLNLSQAEAVADLIDAVTPQQHRLAVSQLRGGYAERLKTLRQQLLDLTSLLELELDFSQEDVEFADRTKLCSLLKALNLQLTSLISSFRMGNALKQGIPVAIVGSPNVGKSTLLNALLDDDRAIVSDIPGTTRDTVEGLLTLDGITFRLVDTAGLRETNDTVERLGIERSRKALEQAFIVIHVLSPEDSEIPECPEISGQTRLFVFNKADITSHLSTPTSNLRPLLVSAKTGQGLDRLKQALLDVVSAHAADEVLLSNVRHRDAMQRVLQALEQVDRGLSDGVPDDLVAVDLRDALYHLGTITGEVANDEILGNIFSRFCIGK